MTPTTVWPPTAETTVVAGKDTATDTACVAPVRSAEHFSCSEQENDDGWISADSPEPRQSDSRMKTKKATKQIPELVPISSHTPTPPPTPERVPSSTQEEPAQVVAGAAVRPPRRIFARRRISGACG